MEKAPGRGRIESVLWIVVVVIERKEGRINWFQWIGDARFDVIDLRGPIFSFRENSHTDTTKVQLMYCTNDGLYGMGHYSTGNQNSFTMYVWSKFYTLPITIYIQCNLWNVASFFLARYGPLSFLEYSFISKTDRSCDAHFADHDIQQSVLEKLASVFLQVLCTAVVIFM